MPFKKGVSGNPAGRPKGSGQGRELREVLRQQIPFERVVAALDRLMEAGDPKTPHYLMDQYVGRPAQAITISGDAERPLHVQVGIGGRQFGAIEAPAPPGRATRDVIDVPIEAEGQWVDEEEPDDTGVP